MLVNMGYSVFSAIFSYAISENIRYAAISFVITFIACCILDVIVLYKRGENGKDVQSE